MNIDEVPQDKKDFKDGANAPKKVMYAVSNDGKYTQTHSVGWEAENTAIEQAWDDIDLQLAETKKQFLAKKVSPIAYYMIKSRMDIGILASYVGKWKWQVSRHLKPQVFKNLSPKMKEKYAHIFEVSLFELENII